MQCVFSFLFFLFDNDTISVHFLYIYKKDEKKGRLVSC